MCNDKMVAMRSFIIFLICFSVVVSVLADHPIAPKIVGGTETTIEQYPFAAVLLNSWFGVSFNHACGGTIINNRAILTAAHCFMYLPNAVSWRVRVGSSSSSSGGVVHNVATIINHPNFVRQTLDNDIAVIHVSTPFTFNNQVKAGTIGGSNYIVADNTAVMAIGWGDLWYKGPSTDRLHHVQVWTVNQEVCRARFTELRYTITDNMLCSGWLDIGGRDQCEGDSGGPLLHNHVVIGVCSWGEECALARYPGVNARVSRYTSWIQSNA